MQYTPQLLLLPIAIFKLLSVKKPLIYERLVTSIWSRISVVAIIYTSTIILFVQEMIRLSADNKTPVLNVCYFAEIETPDTIFIRYVSAFIAIVIAIGLQLYTLICLLRRPRTASETKYVISHFLRGGRVSTFGGNGRSLFPSSPTDPEREQVCNRINKFKFETLKQWMEKF